MVITGIPNVSAGSSGTTNVLVVGDQVSQKKFAKIMFGEEIPKEYYSTNFNGTTINFEITKDYMSHMDNIGECIKTNLLKNGKGFLNPGNKFKVIVATVDVDKNIEEVEKDMRKVVDCICDYKTVCTQILVVACSKSNSDMDFNKLANYTVDVERDCTDNGWGNKRNKCLDTSQFLSFCPLYESLQEDFKKFILELNEKYDYYKKQNNAWSIFDFINEHKNPFTITAGSLGIGLLAAGGLGTIYKTATYLRNKLADKNPKLIDYYEKSIKNGIQG